VCRVYQPVAEGDDEEPVRVPTSTAKFALLRLNSDYSSYEHPLPCSIGSRYQQLGEKTFEPRFSRLQRCSEGEAIDYGARSTNLNLTLLDPSKFTRRETDMEPRRDELSTYVLMTL
jgi:hypothetical protein